MSNLINFITVTNNIQGASIASFRNYANKYGEVANHKIILGATIESAKAKDLALLKTFTAQDLFFKAKDKFNAPFETFKKAYDELYNSLTVIGGKNIDGTEKVKSNRSYGQTNAYTVINSSLKIHNELDRLYIYGLRISKDVIVEGVYPTVNKQAKTVCKDFIKKTLDFKSEKFAMYIVEGIDVMNMSKTSFNGVELSVTL